ncbi:hypothetical protein [uncultured Sphingomonas sp.]|uniref:hypothetical protein n=1 Tax=uncultured Sphingomonas sp. TaxID=158754 RepID=UPI0025DFA114|nr:hypothetical protein [uncultured Sphingomonas sp.]
MIVRTILAAAGGLAGVYLVGSAALDAGALGAVPAADVAAPSAQRLSRYALAAIARKDNGSAEQLAEQSLARAPLNARAIRVMIAARTASGRDLDGNALGYAAALGWRDTPLQLLLLDAAAKVGSGEEVMLRADALARRKQEPATAYAAFRALSANTEGRKLLIARLPTAPWRLAFFQDNAGLTPDDMDAREALFADMVAAGVRPTAMEVGSYIEYLMQHGQTPRARTVWMNLFDPSGRAAAGGVYDSNFERFGRAEGPFAWQVLPLIGASAGANDTVSTGNRVLSVETDGSASGPLVRQTLVLRAGSYRLISVEQQDGPGTDDGFGWSVTCQGQPTGLPLEPEGRGEVGAAVRKSWSFTVPAGCNAQQLDLYAQTFDPRRQVRRTIYSVEVR